MTRLVEHFQLDASAAGQRALFEPRYNIAPTQDVLAVRADPRGQGRSATMLRWGLIPAWPQDRAAGPPLINARAETLAQKPAFRNAYRARRCLIPADGFYEWQPSASGGRGKKQPFYIHRPDAGPFAFAGLWEAWAPSSSIEGRPSTPAIESCTIVTTAANDPLRHLHDRMPVIVAPSDYALWLDSAIVEPAALAHLLAPCSNDELLAEPVSTHVNRVDHDDPRCIARERTLFE